MKQLHADGTYYEAEKIIKDGETITGLMADVVVFQFSGIRNFDMYCLTEGQEFDPVEPTENDLLKAEIEELKKLLGGG